MRFTSLQLRQFRNYTELTLTPHPGTTVIYGANGSGKTNLLEALHLLSLGRSHRTASDREMIRNDSAMALIHGETERLDGRHDIEVRLYPSQKPQKRVLLYGKPIQRVGDMMGHATVVMFSPEDIRIVRDGPAARRRFLDMQLSQIRPGYLHALRTYLNVLESRNALLHQNKTDRIPHFGEQLDAWDEQLAIAAVPIVRSRQWFLEALGRYAQERYAAISGSADEPFRMTYESPFEQCDDPLTIMRNSLRRARYEDERRLFTTFGPHRDDMGLTLCGNELRAFGSQGQLRTAVLSMKLGEISLIQKEMGEFPTLLLDDVFSELDLKRRAALTRSTEGVQTLLTCTDKQDAADARTDQYLKVEESADGTARIVEG